ncbi:MAG: energy transducer TonB [Xanthomonadales bacterium]|nr:energy transducer TonB [Xanthomonadaceae bacterium]MBN8225386.1 energy transducer TonB [Xanthomonadales bacterium]MCA0198886.1 TonB family protein [Pseudomonadota bacterium]
MVRTLPSDASPRLEPQRILAISFAIAVHALALLVLLLPLTQASLPQARNTPEPERWQVPERIPVTPIPPQPVLQPPLQPTQPHPQPAPAQRPAPVPAPAVIDQGTQFADPAPDTATAIGPPDLAPAAGPPLQGAHLRYAIAPPPPYPRDAIRDGAQGTVLLRILVDVDGRPLQVIVERGSGHRSLDREAVRHVQQRWRFEPARVDGRPVQAWGLVPIDFSLQ